ADIVFERHDQDFNFDRSLKFLNSLTQDAGIASSEEILKRVCEKACDLLNAPVCVVWQRNSKGQLAIVQTSGVVDEEFKKLRLDRNAPHLGTLRSERNVVCLYDLSQPQASAHASAVRARGWWSMMSAPLSIGEKLVGLLDVYTTTLRRFDNWERNLFSAVANQTALSIEKAEWISKANVRRQKQIRSRNQSITEIQQAINKVSSVSHSLTGGDLKKTLTVVAEKIALATNATTCFIRIWDRRVSTYKLEAFHVPPAMKSKIRVDHAPLGETISGRVAATGRALNCSDLSTKPELSHLYAELDISS